MTLSKMCITRLVCMLGTGFWYQLIPLSMGYLPKTASGGYRILFQEQVTKSVTWGGGFRAGRANVEIATFNNIPHGIEKSSK